MAMILLILKPFMAGLLFFFAKQRHDQPRFSDWQGQKEPQQAPYASSVPNNQYQSTYQAQ
jgi:hypothetical protein